MTNTVIINNAMEWTTAMTRDHMMIAMTKNHMAIAMTRGHMMIAITKNHMAIAMDTDHPSDYKKDYSSYGKELCEDCFTKVLTDKELDDLIQAIIEDSVG